MRTIYLVRHGQDEDNARGILNGHRDAALTEKGRTQAQMLGTTIAAADARIQAIYSSPLTRARQTAAIITHSIINAPITVLSNLIERDFGEMTGRPYSDIVPLCAPNVFHTKQIDYFLTPKGGETFPQTLARARHVLNALENSQSDKNVLLVDQTQ